MTNTTELEVHGRQQGNRNGMKESACANDVSKSTHALRCLKLLIAIAK